jgi:lipoprotein-anchoring transpeptidase ErfK/SrfK
LVRQVVDYASRQTPGTVIIDTKNTFLYLVLSDTQAMRYGIGVGREGFTWSGEQTVARKTEWPDWRPPVEMISRQPYLPRFMAGGPGNPLGARAMYLGETEYRIHGTNKPDTIGKRVSSGCIRLTNDDVVDLYDRVKVGAKVIVLPGAAARRPSQGAPPDAALRSPDPASPSNRPPANITQMPSSGPKIAAVQ